VDADGSVAPVVSGVTLAAEAMTLVVGAAAVVVRLSLVVFGPVVLVASSVPHADSTIAPATRK
jgi:hypothetical protein